MFKFLFGKKKESTPKKKGTLKKKEIINEKEEDIAEITYKKKDYKLSSVSEEEIAKAIKSLLS